MSGAFIFWRALLAVAALFWAAAPRAAHADWLRAESAHFVVYGDVSERQLRSYVRELEIFHEVLVRRHNGLGRDIARKFPIYLLDGDRDMRQVWPQAGQSVGGVYMKSEHDVFALAEIGDDLDARNTLRHEYVHHFQLAFAPGAYPRWLVEGYAEFYATAEVVEDGRKVLLGKPYALRTSWLLNASWAPTADVLDPKGEVSAALFYPQSWLLTHYFLTDNARLQQLSAYLREIAARRTPTEALKTATGMTPEALERALRVHLRRVPYYAQDMSDFTPGEAVVTTLSEAEGEMLLLAQRTRHARAGPNVVAATREALARRPTERTAILAYARAEIDNGSPEAGRSALQPLLDGPPDAEALALAARGALAQAAKADPADAETLRTTARTYAIKAVQADPDHFPGLIQYLRSRRSLPAFPTDNDLAVAERAVELAPSLQNLRFETATYLERRGRYAEALAYLAPLAADPHGGDLAEEARKRMDAIAARLAAP